MELHRDSRYHLRSGSYFGTVPKASAKGSIVTVSGRSGCAACEHGITPLGAPDELGLAVNTSDGQIIVVEKAHTKWPSIYKARYDGQNFRVKGRVIKARGKIKWLEPTELKVL